MKSLVSAAIFMAAFFSYSPAFASTIGLPGSSGLSSTWDIFPAATFTGAVPGVAATTFASSLSLSSSGTLITGNGDRIYAPGDIPTLWTIAGTATSEITSLSLVIKFTSPAEGEPASYFTLSLDGVAPASPVLLGTSNEAIGPVLTDYNIYQYTWSGLNLSSGSSFQITATSPGAHGVVDALQLTSVPEVSTSVLSALAAIGLLVRRRR